MYLNNAKNKKCKILSKQKINNYPMCVLYLFSLLNKNKKKFSYTNVLKQTQSQYRLQFNKLLFLLTKQYRWSKTNLMHNRNLVFSVWFIKPLVQILLLMQLILIITVTAYLLNYFYLMNFRDCGWYIFSRNV